MNRKRRTISRGIHTTTCGIYGIAPWRALFVRCGLTTLGAGLYADLLPKAIPSFASVTEARLSAREPEYAQSGTPRPMDCDALRQSDGPAGSGFRSGATKELPINSEATRVKKGVVFSISRVQNIPALSVRT